jgi:A/G-specific adenine glycosylase
VLRRRLLRWYRANRRDLPWRRTRDPYAIWVSEIMLQQTRSETVVPYYRRFLRRFPTLRALARARESAVLAAWSGLGYYSRARNLHRTARLVVDRHGGRLPETAEDLLALPGIGRYTAGAIASIAFGVRAPVLDGNVARVLARLFYVPDALRSAPAALRLWEVADRLVPRQSPGDWNQALMELGAGPCRPRRPACPECPVREHCVASILGIAEHVPEPPIRSRSERVRQATLVIEHQGRVLLGRRVEDRLLRGLWEFPTVRVSPAGSAARAARSRLERLGGGSPEPERRGIIRHSIMNQRIETEVFRARLAARARPRAPGFRWFRWGELDALPLSAVGLRIRDQLRG